MQAAASIAELMTPPGARCHQLGADRDAQFSVDLDGPYRLIFEVGTNPCPVKGQ
jgi:proteic killer suppression protein